jgi:hypothetical protein
VIAGLIARLAASRWARAALRCGQIVAAVLLFLRSIRRAGKRTGRLRERLDDMQRINDVKREMLPPRLAALTIAASLLAGCGTGGASGGGIHACPPLVEYGRELQNRAAVEHEQLLDEAAIDAMLRDYAVMREQARLCRKAIPQKLGSSLASVAA